MNYKLKKRVGDIALVKYYEKRAVAEYRQTKPWELLEHGGDIEYVSRARNEGDLKRKFVILVGDLEIDCPTEGAANKVMECLIPAHRDIRVIKKGLD